MTTTPFEERPDSTSAEDMATPADDTAGQATGDGADLAAPGAEQTTDGGPPEELMPDSTPFQAPDTSTD